MNIYHSHYDYDDDDDYYYYYWPQLRLPTLDASAGEGGPGAEKSCRAARRCCRESPTGACEQNNSFCLEPLPCICLAETALQPLNWNSEGNIFPRVLFSGGVFFSQTPVGLRSWAPSAHRESGAPGSTSGRLVLMGWSILEHRIVCYVELESSITHGTMDFPRMRGRANMICCLTHLRPMCLRATGPCETTANALGPYKHHG